MIVLNGDHPVVSADAIRELIEVHEGSGASADRDLGRARRRAPARPNRARRRRRVRPDRRDQAPRGVLAEILAIREINTNQFAFAADALTDAIEAKLGADNAAYEYYLGDVLPLIREAEWRVIAHTTGDVSVNIGVNNWRRPRPRRGDRARADPRAPHARRCVTIVDPATT